MRNRREVGNFLFITDKVEKIIKVFEIALHKFEEDRFCLLYTSFKKFGWAYGLAAAFALLLFVTFAYTSLVPREVNATINGQNYKVESKAFTIDEFLDEQHIKYCLLYTSYSMS